MKKVLKILGVAITVFSVIIATSCVLIAAEEYE